ncbi:hypothetical protein ACIRPX_35610 [Streptomyces sp. NPDC101225]|uniref:hypothetical protein n=1 Tax=Streptomyces sp. NPDC101225 TaxID=3366135 RepID=UPI0038086067
MTRRRRFAAARQAWAHLLHPRPATARSRADDLASLVPLLDRAAFLQPEAEQVIRECAAPGKVAEDLAKRGNAVVVGYWQLRRDLLPVEVSPAGRSVKDEIQRLLLYHEWSVHEAVDCAVSPQQTARMTAARAQMHGLGAPAARLRELRRDLTHEQAMLGEARDS